MSIADRYRRPPPNVNGWLLCGILLCQMALVGFSLAWELRYQKFRREYVEALGDVEKSLKEYQRKMDRLQP